MNKIRCYKCKQYKPTEEFYKIKNKKRGYDEYCKICRRARSLIYVRANKAAYLAYTKQWRKEHPEEQRLYDRKAYASGKTKDWKIASNHRRRVPGNLGTQKGIW